MTTIVSTLFISLDGVAEIDPEWHFPYFGDAVGAAVGEDYAGVDALLLGRVTYDSFAGAWPDREAAGGEDAGFARQLGDLRKVVATRGDQQLGWRAVERTDDVVAAARALRAEGVGTVLVAGSLSIVRQLLAAGELDELRLLIHPVAARAGERLFDDGTMQHLALVHAQALPTGVLRTIYRPSSAPAAAGETPAATEEARERVSAAERQVTDARGDERGATDRAATDRALPVLPSRSFAATIAFYGSFGFVGSGDDGWLILRRGTVQLEFFEAPETDPASSGAMCVLRVADVDALVADIRAAGVPEATMGFPRLHPVRREASGFRIGYLVDVDGTQLNLVEDAG